MARLHSSSSLLRSALLKFGASKPVDCCALEGGGVGVLVCDRCEEEELDDDESGLAGPAFGARKSRRRGVLVRKRARWTESRRRWQWCRWSAGVVTISVC